MIKPSASYVYKIIWVCVYFLVLPQLVFSLIIMRVDYVSNFKQFMGTLNHVAGEQIEIFQKTLETQQSDLSFIHHLIDDKIKQGNISGFDFSRYTDQKAIEGLYGYVGGQNGFRFVFGFPEKLPQDTFSSIFFEWKKTGCQNSILYLKESDGQAIYIVNQIEDLGKGEQSILIEKIDPALLLSQNFYFSDWQKTSASLLYENQVIASTKAQLINKKVQFGEENEEGSGQITLADSDDFFGSYQYFFQDDTFFSILKPIPETKLTLMIDSNSTIAEKIWKKLVFYLMLFMGLILFIGIGIVAFYSKRFKRPISKLLQAMKSIGEGDLKAHYQQTAFGFEINAIGQHFNQMVDSLNRVIEDVKNITVKKEVLEAELKLGETVQRSLLPRENIPSHSLLIDMDFYPAKHVGGDFVDFFEVEKEGVRSLVIMIADTAGKGVFACLYSLTIRALLRAFILSSASIEEGIKRANAQFCLDAEASSVFVTAFFVWIDLQTYSFSYTSCGHLPLLVISQDRQVKGLNTEGLALGVRPDFDLEIKKEQLEEGSCCLLYSDGVIDAVSDQEESRFGIKRVHEAIYAAEAVTPEAIKSSIHAALKAFKGGKPAFDDETLLLFKRPNRGSL